MYLTGSSDRSPASLSHITVAPEQRATFLQDFLACWRQEFQDVLCERIGVAMGSVRSLGTDACAGEIQRLCHAFRRRRRRGWRAGTCPRSRCWLSSESRIVGCTRTAACKEVPCRPCRHTAECAERGCLSTDANCPLAQKAAANHKSVISRGSQRGGGSPSGPSIFKGQEFLVSVARAKSANRPLGHHPKHLYSLQSQGTINPHCQPGLSVF